MMRWARFLTILLMLLTVSLAVDVNATIAAKCSENDVKAVYGCLGNVVRVVSDVPGAGSTFYKPDGKVLICPEVAPSKMGAECVQFMTPNFCPAEPQCGGSQGFPGYNSTNDTNATVASNDSAIVPPKPSTPSKAPKVQMTTDAQAPSPAPSNFEFSLDNLVYAIFLLGALSVGVLFVMFRNSLAEA